MIADIHEITGKEYCRDCPYFELRRINQVITGQFRLEITCGHLHLCERLKGENDVTD